MPEGRVVLTDQAAALTRVEDLVDAELWRADRRTIALAVLRGLVFGMNWESGLVAGVTRAHLAAAAGCSVRTVSRVVAWAVEVELLVLVESGATAEFLGTEQNRAPSYVLTTPQTAVVEQPGNPPASCVLKRSPRQEQGPQDRQDADQWPIFDRAQTAPDRAAAVDTFLERTGLGARVVRWRAIAMLSPWLAEGWCVAGLLWVLDRHPDRPDALRGDATRSARDPLRVLGHRLGPWRGRQSELPPTLQSVDGHARRARAATLAEAVTASAHPAMTAATGARPLATSDVRGGHTKQPASVETRAAARADMVRVLSRPRRHRAAMGHGGR